jgi:hypothetical protein
MFTVPAPVTRPPSITVIENYLGGETRSRVLLEGIGDTELQQVIGQRSTAPQRKSRLTTIQMGP